MILQTNTTTQTFTLPSSLLVNQPSSSRVPQGPLPLFWILDLDPGSPLACLPFSVSQELPSCVCIPCTSCLLIAILSLLKLQKRSALLLKEHCHLICVFFREHLCRSSNPDQLRLRWEAVQTLQNSVVSSAWILSRPLVCLSLSQWPHSSNRLPSSLLWPFKHAWASNLLPTCLPSPPAFSPEYWDPTLYTCFS